MVEKTPKLATYDPNNPRFRRAYIRDRLAALKQERETLVAERDEIDRRLRLESPNSASPAPARPES